MYSVSMVFLPSQWASCPHRGQRQYLIVREFFDNQDFIKLFLNQILIMNNPERRLYFSLLRQGFSDYAQQTSLHGWQYIEVSNTWWGKIFWVFVSCQVVFTTFLLNIFLIDTHIYYRYHFILFHLHRLYLVLFLVQFMFPLITSINIWNQIQ